MRRHQRVTVGHRSAEQMDEDLPCALLIDLNPRTPDRCDARRGRCFVEIGARHVVTQQPRPVGGALAQELRGSVIDHPVTVSRFAATTSYSHSL